MFRIRVDQTFKWNHSPPVWAACFSGSNDRLYNLDSIVGELSAFNREQIELVSVVGGCSVFKLLGNIEFERVTFFDRNVNELTKLAATVKRIESQNRFDGFGWVDDFCRDDPSAFYLPGWAQECVQLEFTDKAQFVSRNKQSWLRTVLPAQDFPQDQWTPNNAEFLKLRTNLSRANRDLYTSAPRIDANGRIVFVYLSHSADGGVTKIRPTIKNARFVIPISASADQSRRIRTKPIATAHQWWEYFVRSRLVGFTAQVYCNSDRIHARKQSLCDRGLTIDQIEPEIADTVVCHHLYSRRKQRSISQFRNDIAVAAKAARKRLIITEYNGDANGFSNYEVSSNLLLNTIASIGFELESLETIPGKGVPSRNLMAVASRKP